MEELKEVMNSSIKTILALEDQVAVLTDQRNFLIGEMRNCGKIFRHEFGDDSAYAVYVSKALEMVGAKCEIS